VPSTTRTNVEVTEEPTTEPVRLYVPRTRARSSSSNQVSVPTVEDLPVVEVTTQPTTEQDFSEDIVPDPRDEETSTLWFDPENPPRFSEPIDQELVPTGYVLVRKVDPKTGDTYWTLEAIDTPLGVPKTGTLLTGGNILCVLVFVTAIVLRNQRRKFSLLLDSCVLCVSKFTDRFKKGKIK
jgi:hypothetical protein